MNQVITFSADLTADSANRTVSGKIVPLNVEAGSTNMGKVIFASGSIAIEDPKAIKLLSQHDNKKPLGRMVSFSESENSIDAVFSISRSQRGTEALILAEEGLQSGLSIGAEVLKSKIKDGVTYVSAARLVEVSLVTEAARPTVSAAYFTKPRIELTAAKYAENSIRAALGDEDARQYLRAAADTTDNAGLVPTRQLSEIINPLGTTIRPSIDAISRGVLPDAGMTFEIPRITQMPTVAIEPEGDAFSDTDQNSNFLSVTVQKYAGQQTFSVELLDRTSPAFFDELVRNMAAAYAKATNAAVNAALIAGATADATTTATYPTASELLGIVARGSASVYGATAGLANPFARNMVVSTGQWSNIMSLNDTACVQNQQLTDQ